MSHLSVAVRRMNAPLGLAAERRPGTQGVYTVGLNAGRFEIDIADVVKSAAIRAIRGGQSGNATIHGWVK